MEKANKEISFNIDSFNDLINAITNYNIETDDLPELIRATMNIYIHKEECKNKEQLVNQLKDFWKKYHNKSTLPLFLDTEL